MITPTSPAPAPGGQTEEQQQHQRGATWEAWSSRVDMGLASGSNGKRLRHPTTSAALTDSE